MTIDEYVNYALINRMFNKYYWVLAMFTLPNNNEYLDVQDKQISFKINGETFPIKGSLDKPILDYEQEVVIKKDSMLMIDKDIKSTIGKTFLNYLLLEGPLGKKATFDNNISISRIERDIFVKDMISDVEDSDINKIYVSDFINFSNAVSYLRGFGDVFTVSATERMLTPPPGIKKFRDSEIKKLKDKYGEDALKDYTHLTTLEEKLKDFDAEYLKGDPTVGIMLTPKITNMSRKRKYLIYGSEPGFDGSDEATTVESSLSEEWPKDKVGLTSMFNSLRLGSYAKGVEIEESGLEAKNMGRATIGFLVSDEDCNTNKGQIIQVDVVEDIIGYNLLVNKKNIYIEDESIAKSFLKKTVTRRSPRYCKSPGDTLCKECLGRFASENKRGLVLGASNLGGKFVNGRMKAMHGKVLETIKISTSEILT